MKKYQAELRKQAEEEIDEVVLSNLEPSITRSIIALLVFVKGAISCSSLFI